MCLSISDIAMYKKIGTKCFLYFRVKREANRFFDEIRSIQDSPTMKRDENSKVTLYRKVLQLSKKINCPKESCLYYL